MRVAVLANQFPALSETFILRQIIDLLELGHDVHVYAGPPPTRQPFHPDVLRHDLMKRVRHWPHLHERMTRRLASLAVLCLPLALEDPRSLLHALDPWGNGPQWRSGRFIAAAGGLRGLDERYDVIHCHFGTIGLVGLFLKRCGFLRGPLLTSFHGADVSVSPRRWGPRVYDPLFSSDSWFTTNSEYTRSRLVALGCPGSRIRLLRMGLRLSEYTFAERVPPPIGQPVALVSIARLTEKKGLEYGLRAVRMLLDRGHFVTYQIVGDGPLRGELEQLIAELGLGSSVSLLGWETTEGVRAVLRRSHVLMQPSITDTAGDEEGQGLALQEAQAMGLPVVATRHNGFPEGLIEGRSGFLVAERSTVELALALENLISRAHEWPVMGRTGRDLVERRFNADKLARRQIDLYDALRTGQQLPQ